MLKLISLQGKQDHLRDLEPQKSMLSTYLKEGRIGNQDDEEEFVPKWVLRKPLFLTNQTPEDQGSES